MCATAPIGKGQPLASIPARLILSVDQALKSEVGQLIMSQGYSVEPTTVFFVYLIAEKACEASFYAPYFAALPATYSDPLWWPDDDLVQLSGTTLSNSIVELKRKIEAQYSALFPSVTQLRPDLFPAEVFTRYEHNAELSDTPYLTSVSPIPQL